MKKNKYEEHNKDLVERFLVEWMPIILKLENDTAAMRFQNDLKSITMASQMQGIVMTTDCLSRAALSQYEIEWASMLKKICVFEKAPAHLHPKRPTKRK